MTKVVSKIGTNKTSAGTAKIEMMPRERPPTSVIKTELASRNPTNIEPQSPIKIEAGLKLKTRNPMSAPMKAAKKTSSLNCPLAANPAARETAAIAAIPAESPSILSSRLIALVMPMSQKQVMAMFKTSEFVHGTTIPKPMTIATPINCPISF